MLSNPAVVVEACVNQLFDDPKYPKVELNRGKRKSDVGEASAGSSGDKGKGKEKRVKIDWASVDRAIEDVNYRTYALVSPAFSCGRCRVTVFTSIQT